MVARTRAPQHGSRCSPWDRPPRRIEGELERPSWAPIRNRREALLPESERALVLEGWNQTTRPYRSDTTIDRLIEEQVERTPDRAALVCEGASIPYRELDQRANRLAAHLAARGAGPERLVAVCLERSIDLVVAAVCV